MIWQLTYKIKTVDKATCNCNVLIETHEKNNSQHVTNLFWHGIGEYVSNMRLKLIEIIDIECLGVVSIKDVE